LAEGAREQRLPEGPALAESRRTRGRRLDLAWEIVRQAVKDFFRDDAPQWAAAIAYYALLSIFPLLLAVVSIAAYFVQPDWAIERATRLLGEYVPSGTLQIEQVVRDAIDQRSTVSVLSAVALIWAGTRVFAVMTKALNVAYDVNEFHGYWRRAAVQVVTFLTLGLFFIVALVSEFVLNWMWMALQMPEVPRWLLRAVAPGVLLVVALFLILHFMPKRRVDWRATLAGAVLTSGMFYAARQLFEGYVERFANYSLVYGSLAIVITLIVWAWVLAMLLLLGGKVVSHIQSIWIEGIPPEEVERRQRARARGKVDMDGDNVPGADAQPGQG
jgi:membrane protein